MQQTDLTGSAKIPLFASSSSKKILAEIESSPKMRSPDYSLLRAKVNLLTFIALSFFHSRLAPVKASSSTSNEDISTSTIRLPISRKQRMAVHAASLSQILLSLNCNASTNRVILKNRSSLPVKRPSVASISKKPGNKLSNERVFPIAGLMTCVILFVPMPPLSEHQTFSSKLLPATAPSTCSSTIPIWTWRSQNSLVIRYRIKFSKDIKNKMN